MRTAFIIVFLSLLASGVGGAIGYATRTSVPMATGDEAAKEATVDYEFVDLQDAFVVPVISQGKVVSLVVMTLQVQVAPGASDMVRDRAPRLRDLFLQELFDHANRGGFDDEFTQFDRLKVMRANLLEIAQSELGEGAQRVLIQGIDRQDL